MFDILKKFIETESLELKCITMKNQQKFWSKTIGVSLILICIFILYYPTFNYNLTNYDDDIILTNNYAIKSLSFNNLVEIFQNHVLYNYQPIFYITYAIEYYFFGLNPGVIHFTNVILFLINIFLVFKFIQHLSGKIEVAMVAMILFAFHASRVEAVAWGVTRSYLLYLSFYLFALIEYIKYLKEIEDGPLKIKEGNSSVKKHYFLSILFFLLACLSKSSAISLSLTLICIDYLYKRKINKKSVFDKIPFFTISIVFSIIAIYSVNIINDNNIYTLAERIQFSGYAILFYLYKFILPVNLSVVYPYPYASTSLPLYFWLFPLMVIIFGVLIFYTKKFTRKIIFGFGFFLVSLVFMLQFFAVGPAFAADRYSYIPFIGLFYIAGESYSYLLFSQKFSFRFKSQMINSILILITILLIFTTFNRIKVWENSITLFTDVIEKYPNLGFAYTNRAIEKQGLGEPQGALEDLDKAIENDPNFINAYKERYKLKMEGKDYNGAFEDVNKWIELNASPDAYNLRSQIYALTGNYGQALNDINISLEGNYTLKKLFNRGMIRYSMKSYSTAMDDFNEIIRDSINYPEAWFFRGKCRFKLNDLEGACADWVKTSEFGSSIASQEIKNNCSKKRE